MAQSQVAAHIVSRINLARRLDHALTIKQAASELGISASSYYKMRAGTRTGQGSIKQRVMVPPKESGYTVTFTDGTRTASRNISAVGSKSRADTLVLRHDPRTRKAVVKQLEREAVGQARQAKGSPAWSRRERQRLRITSVSMPTRQRTEAFIVRERDL